ncbi:flippase-like domain-containing protein [Pseudactinotalea sp. Z1748]|uniref:flippase-like domain-containing protein n=1 Tax=Pseudactinotalea sp. Z1748 TaxID=3413027 RepID=UPI003C7BAB04
MSSPRRPGPVEARGGFRPAKAASLTAEAASTEPDEQPEHREFAGEPGEQPPGEGPRTVQVLDLPSQRVRRPADLLHLIASAIGIAVVLILSVYAHSTTAGVTQDVQSALAQTVRSLLLVPVTVIEGFLILVLPVMVIVTQVLRRDLRGVGEAVVASAVAYLLAIAAMWAVNEFAAGTEAARALLRWRGGEWIITITPTVTALAGLLTAVGRRGRLPVVGLSWNLLWIALGISVITGDTTLVGAIVTVLLGRIAGMAMRYGSGVRSDRAHGADLVQGVRRTGIEPLALVRLGDNAQHPDLQPQTVMIDDRGRSVASPVRAQASVRVDPATPGEVPPGRSQRARMLSRFRAGQPVPAAATVATERDGRNRVYAVIAVDGTRWDVVVLDDDRQVIGMLASVWTALRLRGLARRTAVSLRQATERAALMHYAATAAGVRSPNLRGIAKAAESTLLVGEHVSGARSVHDLPPGSLTLEEMARAWEQLATAHQAGIAHRNLSVETVLIGTSEDDASQVWLTGWEQGEIAASALAQRVDRAQLLTAFALHTDVSTAIEGARQVLSAEELAELAPLLQPVAFPPITRTAARSDKPTMDALRAALLSYLPEGAGAEPIRLNRFSARTVVTLTVLVVALWILVTTLNFDQVREVVAGANPAWMLIAFGLGLVSYLGGALALVAFCPERLGLWRTILVQVAASVLTLVTPAGLGPAALSVRFMQRRGVRTSLALATVGLVQLAQFVTTVLLLVVLALALGTAGPLRQLPSLVVVITLVVVAAVAGIVLLVPRVRAWLARRALPTWRQIWPRLVWVIGQPQRLVLGLAGGLLVTAGFLAAFMATLVALGQSVPITTLTIVYLTGNTIGSAAPTPGGMGTVELALSAGLRTVGLATAAAASAAVLFRVLTFWLRVPLGWAAWRYLQRKEDL